jgi:hypothetical protein
MTDTHIAKRMWDAYAFRAGGITFDGKPLPTWDELGEDRQSCWVAAASVTADRIEKLEAALREPTLPMLLAGKKSLYSCSEDPEIEDARACFLAMVRKALEDSQ